MRTRLLLLLLLCGQTSLAATVALTVTKSGNDVRLTFSGGTGPYEAVAARHPSMSVRTRIVDSAATSPEDDVGAKVDGVKVWFYTVSSVARPEVAITTPQDGSSHYRPCNPSTGTETGATHVYVNSVEADLVGGGVWTCTGHPLAKEHDPIDPGAYDIPIHAAATNAGEDWAFDVVHVTWTGAGVGGFSCVPRGDGQ